MPEMDLRSSAERQIEISTPNELMWESPAIRDPDDMRHIGDESGQARAVSHFAQGSNDATSVEDCETVKPCHEQLSLCSKSLQLPHPQISAGVPDPAQRENKVFGKDSIPLRCSISRAAPDAPSIPQRSSHTADSSLPLDIQQAFVGELAQSPRLGLNEHSRICGEIESTDIEPSFVADEPKERDLQYFTSHSEPSHLGVTRNECQADCNIVDVDKYPSAEIDCVDVDSLNYRASEELEIVSSSVKLMKDRTELVRELVADDDICIVDSKSLTSHIVTALPVVGSAASASADVEVISTTRNCSACHVPLNVKVGTAFVRDFGHSVSEHISENPMFVFRCKHTLCTWCSIKSVISIGDYGRNKEVCHVNDSIRVSPCGSALKPLPVCPAKKCCAPLSFDENHIALMPTCVDEIFATALMEFDLWLDSGSTELATGFKVKLLPFTTESASRALRLERESDTGEWPADDFRGAFSPFWLYDATDNPSPSAGSHAKSETSEADNVTLSWICSACGEVEMLENDFSWGNPRDRSNISCFSGDIHNPDSPPSYIHCARARAYGTVLAIEALSELPLFSDQVSGSTTRRCAKPSAKKRKTINPYVTSAAAKRLRQASAGFAKGTGFGGTSRKKAEWNGKSKRFVEKMARDDAAAAFWLSRIRCFIIVRCIDSHKSWPGFMRLLLRNHGLVAQISRILVTESIMDIGERVPLFVAALRVVDALIALPSLRYLVVELVDIAQNRTIAGLVDSLNRQAALLTVGAGSQNLDSKTSLLIRQIRRTIRGINRHGLLERSWTPNTSDPSHLDVVIAQNNCRTSIMPGNVVSNVESESSCLASSAQNCTVLPRTGAENVRVRAESYSAEDIHSPLAAAERSSYKDVMKTVQFQTVSGLAESSTFFQGAQEPMSSVGRSSAVRRIASEVASLFSSLPLDWSSTILLRVDEDRYDFLRACIFGPEGTPYESGAFVFDIYLPPSYPEAPPKFRLLTTGGGSVRFNPNLYSNGKVCLSLLGTWSGPSWTPASTLLQVLVSVQSLILVEQPYYNEPGFESFMGTAAGKARSEVYNNQVRRNNVVYAMLHSILYSSRDLHEAVTSHFKVKRRSIRKTLREWFPREYEFAIANCYSQACEILGEQRAPFQSTEASIQNETPQSGISAARKSSIGHRSEVGAYEAVPDNTDAAVQVPRSQSPPVDRALIQDLEALLRELDKL